MILSLDFSSEIPIYMQIRNQIVQGISDNRITPGEKLPTIRSLAAEVGVNTMTVNKAYQLLKQEGYITADRRSGAVVNQKNAGEMEVSPKLKEALKLLIAEAKITGVPKTNFIELCNDLYGEDETWC